MTRWSMRSTVVASGVTATLLRIVQHLRGELGDLLRHGGREHQRLPLLTGSLRHDLPDVVDEAHVEHAVGFVEHQHFDAVEAQRVLLHRDRAGGRAWRPARRRRSSGRAPGGPSGRRRWRARSAGADGGHRRGSCRGSGRTIRASGSAPARGRSCVRARSGLAARRLRIGSAKAAVLPVPVCAMPMMSPPVMHERDGLGLDRGGGVVLLFGEGTGNGFGEAEFSKSGQRTNFLLCESRPAFCERQEPRIAGLRHPRVAGLSGLRKKPDNGAENRLLIFVHAARD